MCNQRKKSATTTIRKLNLRILCAAGVRACEANAFGRGLRINAVALIVGIVPMGEDT